MTIVVEYCFEHGETGEDINVEFIFQEDNCGDIDCIAITVDGKDIGDENDLKRITGGTFNPLTGWTDINEKAFEAFYGY